MVEVLTKYDREEISIADISKETSIKISDIVMVLVRRNISRAVGTTEHIEVSSGTARDFCRASLFAETIRVGG